MRCKYQDECSIPNCYYFHPKDDYLHGFKTVQVGMKRSRAEADLLDDNFDIKRRRNNLFGNNTNVLMEDALEISGDGKVEDFIRTFNDVRVQSLKKQVKMLMKINSLLLKKLADKETIIKTLEQNNNEGIENIAMNVEESGDESLEENENESLEGNEDESLEENENESLEGNE